MAQYEKCMFEKRREGKEKDDKTLYTVSKQGLFLFPCNIHYIKIIH